jgi:uncharacterized protein
MITSEKIREIIKTWQLEIRETKIFDREIYPYLKGLMKSDTPIVLHGIRRSGKTYLMYQLLQDTPEAIYVNFEDERFMGSDAGILEEIHQVYEGFFLPERPVMFLDEVQNIPGWEKFVARLHHKVKFIVSGSNATLLSSEYATALTGRHISCRIHPLSFREYLTAKGGGDLDRYITESRARIAAHWSDYVLWGGFPYASLEQEKPLLRSTFEAILYRDVMPRFSIQNPAGMEMLARYLISNPGKLFSYRRLTEVANVKHEDTVKTYIDHLEKSYLITLVSRFDYSIRKQIVNQKKCYPADTSITRFSGNMFSEERGRLLETIVGNHLLRQGHQIHYWKNEQGKEVDFVASNGLKPHTLIQVSEQLNDDRVTKREISALLLGAEVLKVDRLILLTDKEPHVHVPAGIIAKSIIDWMYE